MKISVITPSFNQAQFLRDNLRTVSGQTGATVEHIIVDPGSTDGSTDIARAASHAILMAEPDRGQSHGITKGFARATGDVLVWLNSDDFYPSADVLASVAAAFRKHPDADVIYGGVNFVNETGAFLRKGFVNKDTSNLLRSFQYQVGIVQPGMFMRRKVFETVGGPSEDYHYCMDYEYWVRIAAAGFKWVYLDKVLAHHRWWPGMKTASGRGDSLIEHFKVGLTYFNYIHHKWLDRYGEFMATKSDGVVNHAATVDPAVKAACTRRAIERFVTQDMMMRIGRAQLRIGAGQTAGEEAGAQDTEMAATADYIRDVAPGFRQILFEAADLPDAVSSHPDPMAPQRVAWHVFDTTAAKGRRFKTYEVPDNFKRHFESDWYHDEHERAIERLQRRQARRKDSCVIVANGPSLNRSDLDLLVHADVIISNFAVISKALRERATYLTIVNDLVASQGSVQFNGLDILKVVPFWLGNAVNAGDRTAFLPATVEPVFGQNIEGTFSWRSTVSFLNMQLAFALGYENVVLIGFDHSYQQPEAMKEGTSIIQTTEDPNHFDPRYFQGKTWQAADTGNMEKMYLLARDAYKAAGRRIVNATEGGKLEVFARSPLDEALGIRTGRKAGLPSAALSGHPSAESSDVAAADFPRLLILDMTPPGNGSATGEIKLNLLADWPAGRLLQIAHRNPRGLDLVRGEAGAGWTSAAIDPAAAAVLVDGFAPDLVLYRPVPGTPGLHPFAMETIKRLDKPLVTWVMDDWPTHLAVENPEVLQSLGPDLDRLLTRSALRLSICQAMSDAFASRYGQDFVPLANGIDPADWPPLRPHAAGPMRVRYAGGLAENMTRASVLRIARAVEALAGGGTDVRFEINTQPWWHAQARHLFEGFAHTTIETVTRPAAAYRIWLAEADVLLIAYNFDPATLRYVQYSMANKMPECLVSGAAVLAHGPRGIATIDHLAATGAALVVPEDSDAAVIAALRDLAADPALRADLAGRGRRVALANHDIRRLRETLRDLLRRAADTPRAPVLVPASASPRDSALELTQLKAHFVALDGRAQMLDRARSEAAASLAGHAARMAQDLAERQALIAQMRSLLARPPQEAAPPVQARDPGGDGNGAADGDDGDGNTGASREDAA